MELKPGQIWKHYKGNDYKILILGKHSETGELVPRFILVGDN